MANTPSVGELVVRWQELRGRGQAVSPAELCTGCPELIGEVEHQIEALISMERFVGLTTGTAMDAVTTTDILGCFKHCGYATTSGAQL